MIKTTTETLGGIKQTLTISACREGFRVSVSFKKDSVIPNPLEKPFVAERLYDWDQFEKLVGRQNGVSAGAIEIEADTFAAAQRVQFVS